VNKRNYQRELDHLIEELKREKKVPTLFLHSCCGPCSSYCIEYLSRYFFVTVFYYNPNISPPGEYERRAREQERLIGCLDTKYPVKFLEGNYTPEKFYAMAKGLEEVPEGGERCFGCYEMRLLESVTLAEEKGFDYITTTLSISPLKNAEKLNTIGERLCEGKRVKYLVSDFKKKNGYKESVRLSKEHDLYRQDYCGCVFSKQERGII
jgi:hypothetical protein